MQYEVKPAFDIFVAELDPETLDVLKTAVFSDPEQFKTVYEDILDYSQIANLGQVLSWLPLYSPFELHRMQDTGRVYLMILGTDLSRFNILLDEMVEHRKKHKHLTQDELAHMVKSRLKDTTVSDLAQILQIDDVETIMEVIHKVLVDVAYIGTDQSAPGFYLIPVVDEEAIRDAAFAGIRTAPPNDNVDLGKHSIFLNLIDMIESEYEFDS